MNLVPDAWTGKTSSKRVPDKLRAREGGTAFPAQVRFELVHDFPPLSEKARSRDACMHAGHVSSPGPDGALSEKAFGKIVTYVGQTNHFKFQLDAQQVARLMEEFLALSHSEKRRAQ